MARKTSVQKQMLLYCCVRILRQLRHDVTWHPCARRSSPHTGLEILCQHTGFLHCRVALAVESARPRHALWLQFALPDLEKEVASKPLAYLSYAARLAISVSEHLAPAPQKYVNKLPKTSKESPKRNHYTYMCAAGSSCSAGEGFSTSRE